MADLTRRRTLKVGGAAGLGALGLGTAATSARRGGGADGEWVGTWTASPHAPASEGFSQQGFENATLRQVTHTSVGGDALRLRLTNAYGDRAVKFDSVSVGVRESGAAVEEAVGVTFGGKSKVTVPPGERVYSDRVSYRVERDQDLTVSLYAPEATGPTTWHQFGKDQAYLAQGDRTSQAGGDGFMPSPGESYYFLDGIEVVNSDTEGAIVALGNSITNGVGSTIGENRTYPDELARRIDETTDVNRSVLNAGINGNRILHDSPPQYTFGERALDRLERDVLTQPGLSDVILLEGINDITYSTAEYLAPDQAVTATEIIDGMETIADRVHEHGARIFGGTLTPYKGSSVYTENGEEKRQRVNEFVRSGDAFDGVFDFDEALRDPDEPEALLPEYDSGDHLHPSDAGYRAMAETIDLSAFGHEATTTSTAVPSTSVAGETPATTQEDATTSATTAPTTGGDGGEGGKVPGFTAATALVAAIAAGLIALRRSE